MSPHVEEFIVSLIAGYVPGPKRWYDSLGYALFQLEDADTFVQILQVAYFNRFLGVKFSMTFCEGAGGHPMPPPPALCIFGPN